uniref:Putative tick metalloprotease 1 n=1 Tax=Amblyomma triste TaxID=251400 RepID=A0A023GBJ9_AMBTT
MRGFIVAYVAYISSIFLTCHSLNVPKLEAIVYPEVFDGREEEGIRVLKINDDLTLKLEETSVLHEDFFVRTYYQGVPQHTYYDVEALQQNLYHDKRQLAAVILSEADGALQVEGVVAPNMKIKPIVGAERSENGLHPHLLESFDDSDVENVYGKMPVAESMLVSSRATGFDSTKYNVKDVYPEIFFVVDSIFQSGFNSTKKMLKYLMVVFTVVNIRYLSVTDPRIHLIFRGVEKSNYTQESIYYKYLTNVNRIDALASLYKIVDFVDGNNETYGKYDMVFFLTGADMIAVEGSRQESSLSGLAFVASACTKHRAQLGEDTPYSYRGIRIVAHEVGHTLGCPHDGTQIDGYVHSFRPDSTGCPWHHGYIMSYIEEDSRSMKFSHCCKYQISQMTWSREAACLHTNDSKRQENFKWPVKVTLPGYKLKLNKQCQMTYPTLKKTYYLSKFGIHHCIARCYVPGWQFQASDGDWPMLLIDGTPCRSNDTTKQWRCINGDCVQIKKKQKS